MKNVQTTMQKTPAATPKTQAATPKTLSTMKHAQQAPTRGWVKTPRSLLAHPVSSNPRLLALYITLTLMQPVEGGKIVTTLTALAAQTGISRNRVGTYLVQLREFDLIENIEVAEGSLHIAIPDASPAHSGASHSSLYNKEKKEENIYNNSSSSVLTASPEEFLAEMREIFRQREEVNRQRAKLFECKS